MNGNRHRVHEKAPLLRPLSGQRERGLHFGGAKDAGEERVVAAPPACERSPPRHHLRRDRPPALSGHTRPVHALDRARVEAESLGEGLQRAFLRAPGERGAPCEVQRPTRSHVGPLARSEVVGDEDLAARLDDLEVAAERHVRRRHGRERPPRAVAERQGERDRAAAVELRRARLVGEHLELCQGDGVGWASQPRGRRALRRIPSEPPLRVPLRDTQRLENPALAAAEPDGARRHRRGGHEQDSDGSPLRPGHVRDGPHGAPCPVARGRIVSSVRRMPRSTASIRYGPQRAPPG